MMMEFDQIHQMKRLTNKQGIMLMTNKQGGNNDDQQTKNNIDGPQVLDTDDSRGTIMLETFLLKEFCHNLFISFLFDLGDNSKFSCVDINFVSVLSGWHLMFFRNIVAELIGNQEQANFTMKNFVLYGSNNCGVISGAILSENFFFHNL